MDGRSHVVSGNPPSARVLRRIEFSDVDMSGRYHYGTAIRLLEAAEVELLDRLDLLAGTYTSMPRAHVEFDYLKPLRLRDEVEATITVAAVGRSSVTFTCEIRRAGELCATGRLVAVHVGEDDTSSPWSERDRQRLEGR